MAGIAETIAPTEGPAENPALGAVAAFLRIVLALVLSGAFHVGIYWLWQQEPLELPFFTLKAGRGGTTGSPGQGSRASRPVVKVNGDEWRKQAPPRHVRADEPTSDVKPAADETARVNSAAVVSKVQEDATLPVTRAARLPDVERRESPRATTPLARATTAARNIPPSLAATHALGLPRLPSGAKTTGSTLAAASAPGPTTDPGAEPGPVRPEIAGGNGGAGGDGGAGIEAVPSQVPANPRPPYPLEELRAGVEGVVTLRVLVAADGAVARASIYNTSGSTRLDEQALSTVRRQWRFSPARRGGKPVEFEVLVPIVFAIVR